MSSDPELWREALGRFGARPRSAHGAAGVQAARAEAGVGRPRCRGRHAWEWPPRVARQLTCEACGRVFVFADEDMVKRISVIRHLATRVGMSPHEVAEVLRGRGTA